jgi:mono/diheme cytochrome c family protein
MRTKTVFIGIAVLGLLGLVFFLGNSFAGQQKGSNANNVQIQRGEYLVTFGGCHDCHSPKIFTPQGPQPDPARLLSGHPAGTKLPEIPQGIIGSDKWGGLTTNDLTVWVGPWGVSFSANLTPDAETGLGNWTDDMFIKAVRTGKHVGVGRDILPPMPWYDIAKLNDGDLKAIFAYLRTLKPIKNRVPDPIPPSGRL